MLLDYCNFDLNLKNYNVDPYWALFTVLLCAVLRTFQRNRLSPSSETLPFNGLRPQPSEFSSPYTLLL